MYLLCDVGRQGYFAQYMDESQLRATPDEFGGKDKQMVVVEEVPKVLLGEKKRKKERNRRGYTCGRTSF